MKQNQLKKIAYFLSFILISITLFCSCKKDEGVIDNYGTSYRTWKKFKSSVNNSYEYAVTTASWIGYSTETIITVKNGKVVQRAFLAKTIDGKTGAANVVEQWIEGSAALNTHRDGALTLTLDEVYLLAKTKWLVNRSNTDTFFEAKNQGMLSTAGYNPKGCVDDCFNGIHIGFIRKITSDL